jgi:transposase-like protein
MQKYAKLIDRFVIGRRRIKEIFVDETLLKVDGQNYWLWLAYDEPNLHIYLLFHLSRERTIFVCYQFFRQIRTRFGNKPIFTDSAH